MKVRRTRVKVCGITRVEDAREVVASGADAIGLVFYGPSSRCVSIAQAQAIVRSIPPLVSVVGVFVDPPEEELAQVLADVRLDLVQFHGRESPQRCRLCSVPYIKAIKMRPGISLEHEAQRYAQSRGLLLDTYMPSLVGGTGRTFPWEQIPADLERPVILAGGLTAENVGQAIDVVGPFAVDVSSGVESTGGIKDGEKVHRFLAAVRAADARRAVAPGGQGAQATSR